MNKFIVGFGLGKKEYTVNGVKYILESRYIPTDFRKINENIIMDNRLKKY